MLNSALENTKYDSNYCIRIEDKLIDLSTPLVMGILNVTPDSFYSQSRRTSESEILSSVQQMINNGASIIDVGGYSSRPGAEEVSEQEEIDRTSSCIELISREFNTLTSIDTFRSKVAESALKSGAKIINDISGFSQDEQIVEIAKKHNAPYILMHMRGTPQTMQSLTDYENLFTEIYGYFSEKISILRSKGVKDIILDLGFGFAKTIEQNYFLLNHLDKFQSLGCPILAGISRKSMIYKKLNTTPEASLNGTTVLNTLAIQKGASILRVHDVREAMEIVQLIKK